MGNKHTVLIVDDDTFLLDMYALKLSQSNFEVKTANNPEIAFNMLKGGYEPEVIF